MSEQKQQSLEGNASERGFTLIEVLVSILITLIVMASVFALLTRGQRAFEREPEIADMQQSGRAALDIVSRDILQAGAGLPPEYPAFTTVGSGNDNGPGGTDSIEIIGAFQRAGEVYLDPEVVDALVNSGTDPSCPSECARMDSNISNFIPASLGGPGDLIVVYNNAPNDSVAPVPQWAMARVMDVINDGNPDGNAYVELDYGATNIDPGYNQPNGTAPPDWNTFRWTGAVGARAARVSVIRYSTQSDVANRYSGTPPQVLMRDVDFQGPQAVGYLEDFQITYIIGVTAPVESDVPPNAVQDQAGAVLNADNMIASVRITVTARSVTANMEGASQGVNPEDTFIRRTFSTNVNPRNVSAGLDMRAMQTP